MKARKTLAVVFMVSTFGWILADTITKKREFEGQVVVQVYQQERNSDTWKPVNKLDTPKFKFVCVTNLLSPNQLTVTTNYDFVGTTYNGERLRARMKTPAKVYFDPATGAANMDLVLNLNIDRMDVPLPLRLTTESATGPAGKDTGKRAQLNATDGTVSIAMVGIGRASVSVLSDPSSGTFQQGMTDHLIVVRGEGVLKPKD